jgi:hypothetical protein
VPVGVDRLQDLRAAHRDVRLGAGDVAAHTFCQIVAEGGDVVIVPHAVRRFTGPDWRWILAYAMQGG